MLTLLLVEDDKNLREELSIFMENFFDSIYAYERAEEALLWIEETPNLPNLIVSDICLPNINGLEFLRKVKKNHPSIMRVVISAYPETDYLLESIELKIEKFFIKPFDPQTLIKDIGQIVQKLKEESYENKKVLYLNEDRWIDLQNKTLHLKEEFVSLGKKEQQLLEFLLQNQHHYISEESIIQNLWQDNEISSSTFRSLIKRLRQKLGSNEAIKNIRGFGYQLRFKR